MIDAAVKDQITGVMRIVVPTLLTWATATGWIKPADVNTVTSVLIDFIVVSINMGSIVWSFLDHRQDTQIKRVAQLPAVKEIIITEAKPDLIDHPKINSPLQ